MTNGTTLFLCDLHGGVPIAEIRTRRDQGRYETDGKPLRSDWMNEWRRLAGR